MIAGHGSMWPDDGDRWFLDWPFGNPVSTDNIWSSPPRPPGATGTEGVHVHGHAQAADKSPSVPMARGCPYPQARIGDILGSPPNLPAALRAGADDRSPSGKHATTSQGVT